MKLDPRSDDERFDARMVLLESRLTKEYGDRIGVDNHYIKELVHDACREFADARLRDFVPILVERAVRRKLARESLVRAHTTEDAR
jgi:hypothetical protein